MGKRKQRDDDEYQVEYIIEAQLEGKGSKNWQYLVKWWSFPDSENSKVPESNLAGCERLLKSFWGQFPEHKKWEFPKKAKSSKEWIEKEKKYFASSVKKQKPHAMKKSKTDASQTAGGSTDRRASVASTSTTSTSTNTTTATTARRSKRNMKSQQEVSQADSARTSRSSTLSSVPPSPQASKSPEPAPAPPASTARMPASSSSPATVKKRRTPRDKYKVNTTDEDDDDEEEDSTNEESDEDDKPINKLKAKGKAPAARLPDRAKPTAPVRRNTTLASSQPGTFLKARAASFSTATSSTSKSLAKTTAPSTSAIKSSTASTSKSTSTAKPTDAPSSKTTAKLPTKSAASKSTTVPTPTPQPTMATSADSEPMDIDGNESERDSLFDGDDDADEPETSTTTMPPPDSPLTPMSALSGAATAVKASDPRAQAVASAAATAAKIATATQTATKTANPHSKPSAAAAGPASAGLSKPPRPVGATSTTGPGLKKPTSEMPTVPKVPAHRQKRGLQPLPFDQLAEFGAAVNPTKARIIDRVNNAGGQRPELSINTSASPQEAAAVSPSPALSGSRNVSLEPSSVKPGPSTAKPPTAKVPEASSSKPVASSPITELPLEMQQFMDQEWTAPPPQGPASKPAKASPAPAATAAATRWLQDDDMVMSPVAMNDNGLSGLDAADHRGSTPAKSKSPAVPTPPPAAVHGSSRLRQSVNAPPSGTPVALSSSVTAASSRLSPPAGSASNVTVTASAVSLPAVQPAAQPTLQPTVPPVAGPFIPALKQPAKLPSNSPPAQAVPTTNTSATTTTTTSTFSSAGFGHEGLQWLNAFSADLGILPAPAQQQQPQTIGALGRIPKKWHWEGDLVLGDSQAPLCRLRLHEPWPSQGAEPLFKVLFNSERTSFNLPKTYPLSQAWAFFPLFEARQWAKVVLPESGADVVAYTRFAGHLEANQLFAMARVPSHNPNATHHIVVFHNMLKPLAHVLQCPEFLQTSPQLVAAIVVPAEPQGPLGDPMRAFSWNEVMRYAERQASQLAQKISSQEVQPADLATPHRLGVKLPDALAAQLKGKDFIIYTADLARYHDKRGMVLALGQETTDLLRSCSLAGGTFRTMYERVPFIFIHRDNWRMLHVEHKNLPGLRSKRAEENYSRQFWLYGTSPLCPPRYQGLELKQIFLYGGVVTFTARAVAEDPKGVEALIKRIDKHPLWVCYVLPEVVALVREMTCEPAYEKAKLADGVSAVSALLGPIEKRRLSLMSHPPPSWDDEACRNWIMDITDVSEKKPLEVLDYCIEKLAGHGRPEANKESFVNELVFEDLRQMEGHHIVGTTYRRFVAIVEDLPDTIPPHEGWERKNLRHFKFGDNLDDRLMNGDQSTPGSSATPATV